MFFSLIANLPPPPRLPSCSLYNLVPPFVVFFFEISPARFLFPSEPWSRPAPNMMKVRKTLTNRFVSRFGVFFFCAPFTNLWHPIDSFLPFSLFSSSFIYHQEFTTSAQNALSSLFLISSSLPPSSPENQINHSGLVPLPVSFHHLLYCSLARCVNTL